MRKFVSLTLIVLLNGCYRFVPAAPDAPERATPVRVWLSTPGTVPLGELVAQNVVRVDGEVIEWRPDTLALSATLVVSGAGQELPGQGYTVLVAREQIRELEAKRIDRLRSGLVTGATIAVAVLAGMFASGSLGSGGGPGNGGTTK